MRHESRWLLFLCHQTRHSEPGDFQATVLHARDCARQQLEFGNAGLRRPSTTHSRPQPMRRRRPERGLAQLAGYEAFVPKLPHWGDKRLSSGSRGHFRVETWSFTRKCISVECFIDFLWVFVQFRYFGGTRSRGTRSSRPRGGARDRACLGARRGALRLSQRRVRCSARCCVRHHTASHHSQAVFRSNPPR